MRFDKKVSRKCWRCKTKHIVKLYKEDHDAWKSGGVLIQEAMPYLTPGERELLISGTCDGCWDELFGSDEEECEEESVTEESNDGN